MISGTETIPMPDKKFLPIPFKGLRLMINGNIQLLLKITAHPHIMIARKEMYRNTRVRDLRQLPQDTRIPFGYDRPVFIPEIEEIPYDEDLRGIPPDLLEKGYDIPFPDQALCAIGCAQMKIGEKVYFFSGEQLHAQI